MRSPKYPTLRSFLGVIVPLLCLGLGGPSMAASQHSFAGCAFPDTGQTLCFDNQAAPVGGACPNGQAGDGPAGQDGSYSSSVSSPSYTVYNITGQLVTVDNRTGLMWESTGSYNGSTAQWSAAITCCENSNFAGYSDWRLPNVRELESIVDYGIPAPGPFINATAFPGAISSSYWTSTTYKPTTTHAWYLSFASGAMSHGLKTSGGSYVRCVRGGPP